MFHYVYVTCPFGEGAAFRFKVLFVVMSYCLQALRTRYPDVSCVPLLPGVIMFNRYYVSFRLRPAGGNYLSCIYLIVARTGMYKPKESVRRAVVGIDESGKSGCLRWVESSIYVVAVVDVVGNLAVYGVVS